MTPSAAALGVRRFRFGPSGHSRCKLLSNDLEFTANFVLNLN